MFGMDHTYPDALPQGPQRGRGAALNPGNRFETVRLHVLGDALDEAAAQRLTDPDAPGPVRTPTTVLPDKTRSIINHVDEQSSRDIPFRWTINPYRGCEHGCVYCYARPTHELLGMSSGLDFETRVVAKFDAAKLLTEELAKPSWKGEPIMLAGVTDIYQPVERELKLTRAILQVMACCGQPASLITKNHLVTRDLDLLSDMARRKTTHVGISVTTLDNKLAATLEPRASSPSDRLAAIRQLSQAGVNVMVMVAPIIPGLTDREVPAILQAAADAGAQSAGYVLLRLPHQVKALFLDWLHRHVPERAGHVESLIRQTRDGALYDATSGVRMKGEGQVAEQIGSMFKLFRRKTGLDTPWQGLSSEHFVRPLTGGQMSLFNPPAENLFP